MHILSVTRLASKGVTCQFRSDSSVVLLVPSGVPDSPIECPTVLCHGLSFLSGHYVNSLHRLALDDDSFSALLSPALTPDLWHQHFGHLGLDATCATLTRNYTTGITFQGTFVHEICPSCIIGKSAQQSHPYKGHHASAMDELLHIDTCGPWPVRTPSKSQYAFCVLDDFSNYGFTTLLVKKLDAFDAFRLADMFLS